MKCGRRKEGGGRGRGERDVEESREGRKGERKGGDRDVEERRRGGKEGGKGREEGREIGGVRTGWGVGVEGVEGKLGDGGGGWRWMGEGGGEKRREGEREE